MKGLFALYAAVAPGGLARSFGGATWGVGVFGCRPISRRRTGGLRAQQSRGRLRVASTSAPQRRRVTADLGSVAAVKPEEEIVALDVARLVRRAAEGDRCAWERLYDQYARLVWAMTRDFKLAESDAADAVQATWLRLLEHIDRLEEPARIASWLALTARRECLRVLAARKKFVLVHDDSALGTVRQEPEVDERLLADERNQAVRDALSRLPRRWQRLLELLMADPPASYAEISDQLGLPVGSIGPTRGRCLERLRVLLQASLVSPASYAVNLLRLGDC